MLVLLFTVAARAEEAAAGGGFSLTEIWTNSGTVARGVIFTLLIMFGATIFTGFERWLAFGRARRQSMRLAAKIVGPLQNNDVHGALTLTQDPAYKASYLAAMLRSGLRELSVRVDRHGVENAHRAVEKSHGEELAKLKRGMAILATTASTAPFVGLFGTVFGVINAFSGMASSGAGLASVSAGISEALITTGVGIGVAVFGVWLFNYFNVRQDKVSDEMNSSESDFMDWAHKLLQEPARMAGK